MKYSKSPSHISEYLIGGISVARSKHHPSTDSDWPISDHPIVITVGQCRPAGSKEKPVSSR